MSEFDSKSLILKMKDVDSNIESFKRRKFDANKALGGGLVDRKHGIEVRWLLVFEADQCLEDRMSTSEEIA